MRDKEIGSCIQHRNCRGIDYRIMGNCNKCGREVAFSGGHLAKPLTKAKLTCSRCIHR